MHIEEGYGNPLEGCLRLARALRALDITGDGPRQKLPVTLDIMHKLQGVLPHTYDGIVLWASMTLAFFGCLRASEFCVVAPSFDPKVNLCISDVTVTKPTPPGVLKVHIKCSKTDKLSQGFVIPIGCSESVVCAYCSTKY